MQVLNGRATLLEQNLDSDVDNGHDVHSRIAQRGAPQYAQVDFEICSPPKQDTIHSV